LKINKNVIVIFSILALIFGFIIGFLIGFLISFISFNDLLINVNWIDLMSAVDSILAGIGIVSGVFVAFYMGGQWRKQNKIK
jgi:uncharacterized membrane protein